MKSWKKWLIFALLATPILLLAGGIYYSCRWVRSFRAPSSIAYEEARGKLASYGLKSDLREEGFWAERTGFQDPTVLVIFKLSHEQAETFLQQNAQQLYEQADPSGYEQYMRYHMSCREKPLELPQRGTVYAAKSNTGEHSLYLRKAAEGDKFIFMIICD